MCTAAQRESEQNEGHATHTQAHENQDGLPGEFQRPIHGADRGKITLVDIDPPGLKPMAEIAQKLTQAHGKPGWTISACENRRDALPGCDYLINCIDVGGVECVHSDNDSPLLGGPQFSAPCPRCCSDVAESVAQAARRVDPAPYTGATKYDSHFIR